VVAGLALSACGASAGASATLPARSAAILPASVPVAAAALDPFYRLPQVVSPAPPGAIIRSAIIASGGALPAGATAYRVIYHSESIIGADVAVSGVVVVPGGKPPPQGFPIVSWAHGTTGVADQCAPSLSGFGSIPDLVPLLDARMIVAATDFQGLGTPGVHPYLVGQSEAQDVLDAARAARNLVARTASNTVVVFGYSQGGQAALFAGQIAQSYAPELFLAGVVAVAPVASLTELAPAVPRGLTDEDAGFVAMALYAWSATYGNFGLPAVLTRAGLRDTAVIASSCSSPVGSVYDATATDLLFRPGWSENPMVRSDDAVNQPGGSPISAPVLVVQGTDDSLVPYAATSNLVVALCRQQHDAVRYAPIAGAGHDGALTDGSTTILRWISGRVDRKPAADTCVRTGDVTTG
jgi:pimeloyl-ACP methyl ester carboxylesterase